MHEISIIIGYDLTAYKLINFVVRQDRACFAFGHTIGLEFVFAGEYPIRCNSCNAFQTSCLC